MQYLYTVASNRRRNVVLLFLKFMRIVFIDISFKVTLKKSGAENRANAGATRYSWESDSSVKQ
jgi:hypothetical protein